MNQNKKWCIGFIGAAVTAMVVIGIMTIVVDPYFHYHKPLDILEYPLSNERQRYINDGIIRNFEYDAIIIGSSMTENFKTSQVNNLFGVDCAKACYMGITYYEIAQNVQKACDNHEELKMIITSLDITRLCDSSNAVRDDMGIYPTYLYDENYLNDVQYILNKDVILDDLYAVLSYTSDGRTTTSFDEYSNWMQYSVFGEEAVNLTYGRIEETEPNQEAMDEQRAKICGNITDNIIAVAKENPAVQFYIFYPPYSIYYWDDMNQRGLIEWQFENMMIATELLLECDNIHIYSFFDEYDFITNLDNYKDIAHYSEEMNEKILECMAVGRHELNKENYTEYFYTVMDFYKSYNYETHFSG